MALSPETLVTIVRAARAERAKRRAMRAEAVAAEGRDLTWEEVVAWHERKPPKRRIHMGRLDENAKMPPPGTVITGMQIRNGAGEVLLDERFEPPIVAK